jgi:hypothetical protein
MLKDTDLIEVINRSSGGVGYEIPDSNGLIRTFQKREKKKIPFEEIRKLLYQVGGEYIFTNLLVIKNEEAVKELFSTRPEPEYYYTEVEVRTLLETGTLDQLLDCLDFAPEGVIDIVKDVAVKIKLNDVSKRDAILAKTGFNVSKAIEINEETDVEEVSEKINRRTSPITSEEKKEQQPQRRVPNYKVTSVSK